MIDRTSIASSTGFLKDHARSISILSPIRSLTFKSDKMPHPMMLLVCLCILPCLDPTNGKITCSNPHNHFSIRLVLKNLTINPYDQLKGIERRLISTTDENQFCLFRITLFHEDGRFQVHFGNLSQLGPSDEVLRTITILDSDIPWSTIFEGICWTDLCDRERILAAARWMLFEGRSYFMVRSVLNGLLIRDSQESNSIQCYTLRENGLQFCHAQKCLALNEVGQHVPRCVNSPGDPLVNVRTLVTFRAKHMSVLHEVRFLCTRDFCNGEENSEEILRLTRKHSGIMSIWNANAVKENFAPDDTTRSPLILTEVSDHTETISQKHSSTSVTLVSCQSSSSICSRPLSPSFIYFVFSVLCFFHQVNEKTINEDRQC